MTLPPPRLPRLCLLLLTVALLLAGGSAGAEPVRTALAAPAGDGAWRFLTDLAELWRNRYEPTNERLAVRPMADARARLQAVSRGRGDLAVVDAATAAEQLAQFPRLTALAALWPNLLHAVTRNASVSELRVPVPAELWALDNAGFAVRVLAELTRNDPAQQALLQTVPDGLLSDGLDYAQGPLLLFTAPVPLRELALAQRRDATLHLLPIAGKLVDELKLAYPWLVTESLEPGAYAGLQRKLELPAVYGVLVGRRDLPAPTVRKVLDTVYGRTSAMARFNPLFGQTNSRMNAVLGKLMPFHSVTARQYGFVPSVP